MSIIDLNKIKTVSNLPKDLRYSLYHRIELSKDPDMKDWLSYLKCW